MNFYHRHTGVEGMQILTIMGSPRKKGNTAGVLDMVEQELSIRHRVERLAITSVNVNGCLGCETCKKVTDRTGCVQKDDAASVFKKIMAADAVIYSSPLYCWDFPAQMKALIDRHFCLVTGAGTVSHRSRQCQASVHRPRHRSARRR